MSLTDQMHGAVNIGTDHLLKLSRFKGEVSGVQIFHKRPDGTQCHVYHWVTLKDRSWDREFKGGLAITWEVVQDEPLTLKGSIKCQYCGDHGYVRDGKWEKV